MKPSEMPRSSGIRPPERIYEPCPHPEKRAFRSKAAARRDARLFTVPVDSPWEFHKQRLYPYECPCGKWHLTSEER